MDVPGTCIHASHRCCRLRAQCEQVRAPTHMQRLRERPRHLQTHGTCGHKHTPVHTNRTRFVSPLLVTSVAVGRRAPTSTCGFIVLAQEWGGVAYPSDALCLPYYCTSVDVSEHTTFGGSHPKVKVYSGENVTSSLIGTDYTAFLSASLTSCAVGACTH
jgi:hypothetical protein